MARLKILLADRQNRITKRRNHRAASRRIIHRHPRHIGRHRHPITPQRRRERRHQRIRRTPRTRTRTARTHRLRHRQPREPRHTRRRDRVRHRRPKPEQRPHRDPDRLAVSQRDRAAMRDIGAAADRPNHRPQTLRPSRRPRRPHRIADRLDDVPERARTKIGRQQIAAAVSIDQLQRRQPRRIRLTMRIVAPAHHPTSRSNAARVPHPSRNSHKPETRRHIKPTVPSVTPANRLAAAQRELDTPQRASDGTPMRKPDININKIRTSRRTRHRQRRTPALNPPKQCETARKLTPGINLRQQRARRHTGLAVRVVTPAHHLAVRHQQPAKMIPTARNVNQPAHRRDKISIRRVSTSGIVPTHDISRRPQPARLRPASHDLIERPAYQARPLARFPSPTPHSIERALKLDRRLRHTAHMKRHPDRNRNLIKRHRRRTRTRIAMPPAIHSTRTTTPTRHRIPSIHLHKPTKRRRNLRRHKLPKPLNRSRRPDDTVPVLVIPQTATNWMIRMHSSVPQRVTHQTRRRTRITIQHMRHHTRHKRRRLRCATKRPHFAGCIFSSRVRWSASIRRPDSGSRRSKLNTGVRRTCD